MHSTPYFGNNLDSLSSVTDVTEVDGSVNEYTDSLNVSLISRAFSGNV